MCVCVYVSEKCTSYFKVTDLCRKAFLHLVILINGKNEYIPKVSEDHRFVSLLSDKDVVLQICILQMLVLHGVKFYAACLKRPRAYFPHQMSDKRLRTRQAYRSVSSLGLSCVAGCGRCPGMQLLEEKNSPCLKLEEKVASISVAFHLQGFLSLLETQPAVWTDEPMKTDRYFGWDFATTSYHPQDHLFI